MWIFTMKYDKIQSSAFLFTREKCHKPFDSPVLQIILKSESLHQLFFNWIPFNSDPNVPGLDFQYIRNMNILCHISEWTQEKKCWILESLLHGDISLLVQQKSFRFFSLVEILLSSRKEYYFIRIFMAFVIRKMILWSLSFNVLPEASTLSLDWFCSISRWSKIVKIRHELVGGLFMYSTLRITRAAGSLYTNHDFSYLINLFTKWTI